MTFQGKGRIAAAVSLCKGPSHFQGLDLLDSCFQVCHDGKRSVYSTRNSPGCGSLNSTFGTTLPMKGQRGIKWYM